SFSQAENHSLLGPQSGADSKVDSGSVPITEPEGTDEVCQDGDRFRRGERHAEANARAGAERQIGEARGALREAIRVESTGIERVRPLPVATVAMDRIDGQDHDPSLSDVSAGDLGILPALTDDLRGRGVEAQRFHQNLAGEQQSLDVGALDVGTS